jgi:hypothetical protein
VGNAVYFMADDPSASWELWKSGGTASGTVCRAMDPGGCDVGAEACDGINASCPADSVQPAGTACTPDASGCTVDECNGTSNQCQHTQVGSCGPDTCDNAALQRLNVVAKTSNGGNTADKAIDTSMTSRWESVQGTTADPSWIYVDLGVAKHISQVILRWEGASARNFTLSTAPEGTCAGTSAGCLGTDTPWTTIYTSPSITTGARTDTVPVSGTGRYVRMKGTVRNTAYGYSLYDFQINGDANISCGTCDPPCGPCSVCPANSCVPLAAGTVCRAAVPGGCDTQETCDGTATTCPVDSFAPALSACSDDQDSCTEDVCSGTSGACLRTPEAGCSHGLTATYYNNRDFSGTTVVRIDPNINFTWGNGSPDPAIDVDSFSVRWTGQIEAPYTDTYSFNVKSDDGFRLWIDGVLHMDYFTDGVKDAFTGAPVPLVAGTKYDIKMDFYENGGGASARLLWSAAANAPAFAVVPTGVLYATGDDGVGGFDLLPGDPNAASGFPYTIWRTSKTVGVGPVNVTGETANNWGLGDAVMQVPSFAPDGTKLVFLDGDAAGGAGWRKGLSVWDFNQTGKLFSNRRLIFSTWAAGDVMKWPTFESDSRSVIFQTSYPDELCWACDAETPVRYGNNAPTNYYTAPGYLWSIDSDGNQPAVRLDRLNNGETIADAGKSYQATVLPTSAGGYRWVVFTSTRPYGNVLNPAGSEPVCLAPQLWIAALDNETSGVTDRSHPPFWLPNQNLGDPSVQSFVNERGYWVLEPCRPVGTGATSECQTSEDCCGGTTNPPTAACRIDQPVSTPPTRHCAAYNAAVCSAAGESCTVDGDCCNFPGTRCVLGVCKDTPPVVASPDDPMGGGGTTTVYSTGTFERDYEGTCPEGAETIWRYFDWKVLTPGDSEVRFYAQTADTKAEFDSQTPPPLILLYVAKGPAPPLPPPPAPQEYPWNGVYVDDVLPGRESKHWLRITMELVPSSDRLSTPSISDWRQSYSCVASE